MVFLRVYLMIKSMEMKFILRLVIRRSNWLRINWSNFSSYSSPMSFNRLENKLLEIHKCYLFFSTLYRLKVLNFSNFFKVTQIFWLHFSKESYQYKLKMEDLSNSKINLQIIKDRSKSIWPNQKWLISKRCSHLVSRKKNVLRPT